MTTPTEESYLPLQEAYDFFNRHLFEGALPACLITFQRQKRIMGYVSLDRWTNDRHEYTHELAINPEYFANYPLIEICQMLCHEMVHIWQAHFGSPGRRGYHNMEWAQKMIAIGLMPTSTGELGGNLVGEAMDDYILDDGEFLAAFKDLQKTGFHLKWVDRYPVIRTVSTAADPQVVAAPVQPGGEASTPLSSVAASQSTDSLSLLPYTFEELDAAFTAAYASQLQPASLSIPTTRPKNPKTKHKYRCPKCHMQLWGKPDLSVVCGECQSPLVEME